MDDVVPLLNGIASGKQVLGAVVPDLLEQYVYEGIAYQRYDLYPHN